MKEPKEGRERQGERQMEGVDGDKGQKGAAGKRRRIYGRTG
jgi:hypothetical protein